ncbi:DUF3159 domain-containing protein [Streptomyces globisporus]|uniref:DUF3159 domain-containing protein n=1 Tax=Streptomyces globisporus TaxID=1908 RepID=UPI00365E805A
MNHHRERDPGADGSQEPGTSPPAAARPTMVESMGGTAGFVYSTVPVVVFVIALALQPTEVAVIAAIVTGVLFALVRMVRGERFLSASGSLAGVLVAAGIVALTGSAKDFFLLGIWVAFAGFVVTFGSVLMRSPLSGVAWNLLHGGTYAWRENRTVLHAHDVATLAAALVLGARFVVKQWLYVHDSTGWLAFAKIAMGTPLTVVAALAIAWAFRRTSTCLVTQARPAEPVVRQGAGMPPQHNAEARPSPRRPGNG